LFRRSFGSWNANGTCALPDNALTYDQCAAVGQGVGNLTKAAFEYTNATCNYPSAAFSSPAFRLQLSWGFYRILTQTTGQGVPDGSDEPAPSNGQAVVRMMMHLLRSH